MTFLTALQEAYNTGCAIRPVGKDHVRLFVARNDRNEPTTYIQKPGARRREPGMYPNALYYALPWEIVEEPGQQSRGITFASVFPDLLKPEPNEREWKFLDFLPAEAPQERKWTLADMN